MSQFDEYVRAGSNHAKRLDAIYDALITAFPNGDQMGIFRNLTSTYMQTDGDIDAVEGFFNGTQTLRVQGRIQTTVKENT